MGGPQFHKRLGEYLRAWPRLRHPQFQAHDKDYHPHVECGHTLLGFRWSSDPKSNHHLHSEKANYVYSSSRYYKLWHKRWWPCRLPWSYSLHRRLLRRSRFLRGLKSCLLYKPEHLLLGCEGLSHRWLSSRHAQWHPLGFWSLALVDPAVADCLQIHKLQLS